jgi:hypothetical protein
MSFPLLMELDLAADIHICNDPAEFQWKAPATNDDIILTGNTETPIQAWGEVALSLSTPNSTLIVILKHVALIPTFFINLVSLARLLSLNIYFDSGKDVLYRDTGTLRSDTARVRSAALHHCTTATKKGTNDRPTQSSCAE